MYFVAGCAPTRLPANEVPQARQTAEEIRERYQRINPANRVGVVLAVLPRENLAAVGDIAVKDFAMGDTLVFIDDSENPIIDGTVVNITDNALHLRYSKPKLGRREPKPGDLAVRVASP
jgi:hypothetical protein